MQDLSASRDCAFSAFITNLGKYNEGYLIGEWVTKSVRNFFNIGLDDTKSMKHTV